MAAGEKLFSVTSQRVKTWVCADAMIGAKARAPNKRTSLRRTDELELFEESQGRLDGRANLRRGICMFIWASEVGASCECGKPRQQCARVAANVGGGRAASDERE